MKNNGIAVNLISVFLANGIALAVSGIASFFVPKFLADVDYGYWQLFVFYASYIGLFHFGLQDGIYLRYGGKRYEELDKRLFHTEVLIVLAFEVFIAAVITVASHFMTMDPNRRSIFRMFGFMCIIYLPSSLLQYIMLMTNRIVDYSKCIITEKAVYGIFMVAAVLLGYRSFSVLILADICGRLTALCYGVSLCKEIVFSGGVAVRTARSEVWQNIKAGVPLLLANLAGMFVVGIARFAIEIRWDIVSFGYVSMAVTMCNFILVFLAAIGQVLFPLLKRAPRSELPDTYRKMSCGIVLLVGASLLTYQQIKWFIQLWSPNYSGSIAYLALLFPMCIFEGKTSILLNTYINVLRKEKTLLIINIGAMLCSALLSGISVFLLNSITWAAVGIVAACAFRCIACEIYLLGKLKCADTMVIILECVLSIGFLLINQVCEGILATVGYFLLLCLAAFLCRKTVVEIMRDHRAEHSHI